MRVFADDGGLSSLSGALMISLTLVLLVLLVLALTATLIVWRVYRRVRRWRGWHRGAAAIHSRELMPGPGRDIARLRRDLRNEVEAAEVMLSRAKDGRLFIAGARALVDELKIHAAAGGCRPRQHPGLRGYHPAAQRPGCASSSGREADPDQLPGSADDAAHRDRGPRATPHGPQ